MAATLAKKATAMSFQVPNEVDALHARLRTEAFANDAHPNQILFRERAIRLEHELHRFAQIGPRFVEGFSLRVGAGKFLDRRHVAALRGLPKDGRPLERSRRIVHVQY